MESTDSVGFVEHCHCVSRCKSGCTLVSTCTSNRSCTV